ncbi:hypothetical protein MRX96_014445 [Rhipicephalus microplus]
MRGCPGNPGKFAQRLLRILFSPEELEGESLFGKKCNAKKDQEAKEPLDPVRVKAVIGYTVTNLKADPVRVKTSLSTMLSRELGPAQVQEVSPDKNQVKQKRPDPKSRHFPAPPGPECSGLCDLPGAENFPEDSPTKQFYKDKVLSSQEEITQLKKKVKTLQQTKRRLVKRNETAQEIIKEIREQKLLSEEGSHVFSSVFSDDIQQLLCRVGNEQKGKYPPELRAFALTLHFYSPAAYEYVRSKFNEALPSQRTLRG